jgi:hypothetical protein
MTDIQQRLDELQARIEALGEAPAEPTPEPQPEPEPEPVAPERRLADRLAAAQSPWYAIAAIGPRP